MSILDRYRAAVFDLDGTLADSLALWDRLNLDWCAGRGLDRAEEFARAVEPLSTLEAAHLARRMYGLPDSVEQLVEEWQAISCRMYAQLVKPMPGAVELIHELRRRGWPMTVATASFREGAAAFLRRYGLLEHFHSLHITAEVGREKEYPDVYLAAARAMGVDPAHCLVFGDLSLNARGVRAAGMGLVLVRGLYEPASRQAAARLADLAVDSLADLL